MANAKKDVEAPGEAPKVEAPKPMTEEGFLEEFSDLMKRGKAAGLNTTQLLFRVGVRGTSGLLDEFLGAIQFGAPRVKK